MVVGPPAGENVPPTRSGIRLFHDRVNVEDVPIRVTHVEGTMAPRVGRQAAVKACEPPSVRCSLQDTTQKGVTLVDLWQTRSLWQSASLRACMWLESRSGAWSIARSRAEVSTGQTDLLGAKTAPCPEWSTSRVLR